MHLGHCEERSDGVVTRQSDRHGHPEPCRGIPCPVVLCRGITFLTSWRIAMTKKNKKLFLLYKFFRQKARAPLGGSLLFFAYLQDVRERLLTNRYCCGCCCQTQS